MPDQEIINSVAGKFQTWASGSGKAAITEWMTGGQDVQGHSAEWWQGEGAWADTWKASWDW